MSRVIAAAVAVFVLTEIAVLLLSLWPQPDREPFRAGYGTNPPSQTLLRYVRAEGVQLVPINFRDRTVVSAGRVDVSISSQAGVDAAGVTVDRMRIDYDPQLPRPVYAAQRLEELIDGYPGVPKAHADRSAIADAPFTFHLFFDVVLPLVVLLAVAAGALAGRPKRSIPYGVLVTAVLLVALFVVLPGTDFGGPEGTSSNLEFVSPLTLGAEILAAGALAVTLAQPAAGRVNRSAARALAAAAAVLTFLFSASLWDSSASAWIVTAAPPLLTGSALLACAALALAWGRWTPTAGPRGL